MQQPAVGSGSGSSWICILLALLDLDLYRQCPKFDTLFALNNFFLQLIFWWPHLKKIKWMCKFSGYAMPKWKFRFSRMWPPQIFFPQVVNLWTTTKPGNFVIAGKDRQGVVKICSGPPWLICIDINFMKKIRLSCYSFLHLFCLIIFFTLLKKFFVYCLGPKNWGSYPKTVWRS